MSPSVAPSSQRIEITSERTPVRRHLREIWNHRELLYFFAWRDLKVRYKQTAMGALWAVIQPFLLMVVFALIFGRVARLTPEGIPAPIFFYAGLLPWTYFSNAVNHSTGSLSGNQSLVQKVYFPRLILPSAAMVTGLVDLTIAFSIVFGMQLFYGVTPGPRLLVVPLFVALAAISALAIGVWTSALNAAYRDFRYAVPVLVQLGLFLSPVAYPSSLALSAIPQRFQDLYFLNPMACVVEGFRWAIIGTELPPFRMLALSTVLVLFVLGAGLRYFWRRESTLADFV